jgi:hypothetical protein
MVVGCLCFELTAETASRTTQHLPTHCIPGMLIPYTVSLHMHTTNRWTIEGAGTSRVSNVYLCLGTLEGSWLHALTTLAPSNPQASYLPEAHGVCYDYAERLLEPRRSQRSTQPSAVHSHLPSRMGLPALLACTRDMTASLTHLPVLALELNRHRSGRLTRVLPP